ncbi:hypothetical protein HW561_19450 [Rhodobacteraceae bacterium B1Z28]|uniref:Galactosyltransferase Lgt5 n=2 Tax=Ruegeria haliotis TaxID=2747601 RepID=A0ABX2PVA8_9RHOB|nr:hypothetical protein [Ruegeria haliotis]
MLWVDGPLSFLEQLCIKSYLDVGQAVRLYTYGNVTNIPDGVEQRDAREVLPDTEFVTHDRTGSPAPHSDKFRYRMLAQETGLIWADTDAYCIKPFTTPNGHYYGYLQSEVAIGVLGLPSDCETLGLLIEYTEDPFLIPPWLPARHKALLLEAQEAGNRQNVPETIWGVWGPQAFAWALHQTGEIKYALPEHIFYPISYTRRRAMARPNANVQPYIKDDTVSIHFYGRRMRAFIGNRFNGIPDPDSLIGRLVSKHGIDPHAAPLSLEASETDDAKEAGD